MINYVSGVGAPRYVTLRSLLKCEDHWKINSRRQHEETYTALWGLLLLIGKIDEALLFAAEQGPIVDLLGPEDDELVIFSNGELCLTPWAAVIKWIRIRIVRSLTSYRLILIISVPESHHRKTGAVLVGNPYLEQ